MDSWFVNEARKGNIYHAHNVTTGDITVLSSTCTGLVLENPSNSGKELVVAKMSYTGVTLTTIREVGVAVSSVVSDTLSTSVTAAVIHNGRMHGSNSNKGKGRAYSVATLPNSPVWLRPLASARVTGAKNECSTVEADFDGTLIVMPGTYVCFSALTTATAALCSITWAEI